ncbi:ABC transporter ATP-binding protein [Pelomonas sp. SE-A7]|uniref:ABC transporter ATP-binding protein n=1 Tax=Pelomonas sp. SE-A7 TaxID=3054953 RepID=UPI00259C8337|nr:ABC transporter ATP-binding protein [Pelomonas sp. SE-A7]MDM4764946.1 ABC transporter ATP-binding protein [Pelomonas sp. SE-A7]
MLTVEGLCKSFGGRQVVNELSLELRAGQTLGLLGPNGAGKSTTVAMICGLLPPDQGRVLIDGQALIGDADPKKRRIGLVPQELGLYEQLSAEANLKAFASLYGLSGETRRQRVVAALQVAGLAERRGDKVDQFSGGMKRRLNIACALVHEPDVLIFDEPTVGVDPQSRNAIFDTLIELRAQGRALLYTTHYMEEAERLCDRIVIMDQGRVIAQDSLSALLARLPMAASLELRIAGTPDEPALQAHEAVQSLERQGDQLRMGLSTLEAVPDLLNQLQAQGVQVLQLSSGRASLEALFLSLTGRSLRD